VTDRAQGPRRGLPTVVVVDDHSLFRAGVANELTNDIELVGEASDVDEAVKVILCCEPDVVLLDVHLPGGGGAEVLRRSRDAGSRVLAISVSDAADDVIGLVRAGARGYVTKSIAADDLADAVRRVADGDAYFSPKLAGFVLDSFGDAPAVTDAPLDEASALDQLTAREREVMQLLARGYAYKEIAAKLHISIKTVESHASAVLRKLQLSSRHELARWAAERDMY
jgi:DNA-binding NarL/FixJ family response regulator